MKKIPLSQGKFALVDDEDFEWLSQWRRYAEKLGGTYYGARNTQNPKGTIRLHRLVMGAKQGEIVDHIDHDGLNNQKENLRICSYQTNILNRRDLSKANKSGVSGVCWSKQHQRWTARTSYKGKMVYIGQFKNLEDAAMAVINYQPKQKI